MHRPTRTLLPVLVVAVACGGSQTAAPPQVADTEGTGAARTRQDAPDWQGEAERLLAFYQPRYVSLRYEAVQASWVASTDVTERHTGQRTGAWKVFRSYTGSADFIERAKALLDHRDALEPLTARQLEELLEEAASAPQTDPDLARRRIEAESEQSAKLDSFEFCLRRRGDDCRKPITTNDIDRVLEESDDLDERLRHWRASKEVGPGLKDGVADLQGLRNGVAREMGYEDYYDFQMADYGMSVEEMMTLLDELVQQTRPLFEQLHCWAKYRMAERYGVDEPPELIPAHWIGNRWAQRWPGLVEGVDRDALLEGREPEWLLEQAERFYVSMGFPELPESFYERSDLYPVPEGQDRDKNDHASAWHLNLGDDVRSLMSVEANWRWFGTTHHELGHIYYYLAYTRDEVPPLLRDGANRSFHEGIGTLIEHASSMTPYLVELELMKEQDAPEQVQVLLDSALTGPIVFLPFAAGTMSHFEQALYVDELPKQDFQRRWWDLVARYQGVAPPSERPEEACDACTKTHINDDPGQYYDYALSEVLVYQLHDHICRELLEQDPHECNYYDEPEVGAFLQDLMEVGATRDWREVLHEATGSELSAEPMLAYYEPLLDWLKERNADRACGWDADEATAGSD